MAGNVPVQQIITDTSLQYGVPPYVSLSIAYAESSFNPGAYGDYQNGVPTSFGLFQLHRGGQAGNWPTQTLLNPSFNSRVGIANIAKADQNAARLGLSGFQRVQYDASNSGHPGYAGVGAYPAYDAGLYSAYQAVRGTSYANATTPGQAGSVTYDNGRVAFLSQLDDKLSVKGGLWGAILHGGQDASAISLRIVLVEIGILLLIFGLIKAIGASNITNAATTAASIVK